MTTTRRMKESAVGGKVVSSWQRETLQYLADLQSERDDLADKLADVDGQMSVLNSAMNAGSGSKAVAVVATRAPIASRPRSTTKKRGSQARGGIAETILGELSKKKGTAVPAIVDATGLEARQVAASLMSLKKQKRIRAKARGVYVLA